MGNMQDDLYFCTYCAYYGFQYEGTRRDLVAHAHSHPIGDPRDCVIPVGSEDRCPACGEIIDYCQGHGESGDPVGHTILTMHDNGVHTECHVRACQMAADGPGE